MSLALPICTSSFFSVLVSTLWLQLEAEAEAEEAEAEGQGCRAGGRPVFGLLANESRRVPSCVSDELFRQQVARPQSSSSSRL